jgi:thiamine-monophosphate kinase
MGARPLGLLFSFGLPRNLTGDFIQGLAKGISKACEEHDTCILGGDTKESEELVIGGTALGKVKKDRFLTRKGAKKGDVICVTGNIGSAAGGFYCLVKKIKNKKFIKAALEPKARIKEGMVIAEYANACIDISDGLAFSLHQIAKGKGFLIKEKSIPIEESLQQISKQAGVSLKDLIFYKGGDYELLFTIERNKLRELKRKIDVKAIGRITEEGFYVLDAKGKKWELESKGHESFTEN